MRFAAVVVAIFAGVFLVAIWLLRPSSATPASHRLPAAPIQTAKRLPQPTAREVNSQAPDITAGGPAPARTEPEQHSSMDDVNYIPPVGLRQDLTMMGDEKSILVSRLERLISAKVGRVVDVPRAWAFKERDGDMTICGAYMGLSRAIIFVYNTGGVKGTTPALYLNVDEQTYNSFGCDQPTAVPLIGA